MTDNPEERREYFRINDLVGISYSVVQKNGQPQPIDDTADTLIQLDTLLSKVDQEINEASNALWRESPKLAHSIGLLNRKVSLLAAHVLRQDLETEITYEELTANISGCGMAFHSDHSHEKGTHLQVAAQLKPSNVEVKFTAQVVACDQVAEVPSKRFMLRISIDESCTAAREQLIQHVVQRQFDVSRLRSIKGAAATD